MNLAIVHPKIESASKESRDFLGFKVITDPLMEDNVVLVYCDGEWTKITLDEKKCKI